MIDKKDLRYKYKIKRKYFQHSAREVADGAIRDAVIAALTDYDSVFIYFSFDSEADTHTLIDKLIAMGKRVYLPKIDGDEMIAIRYTGDRDKLIRNTYGIFEPYGYPANEDIQVCIAPLLAVNERGYRLGYGGGYYDKYFKTHDNIIKIGLGYFLQYAEDFTEETHDEPLDKFICERGIIDFGK